MDWESLKDYKWWLAGAAAMLIIVVIALFFTFNRPIKQVKIVGRFNQLTPECVYSVLGSAVHGRYWPSHQQALLTKARSHCPWLYAWQWHYHWPSTLVIQVQENQPQLVFNQQSLLNQNDQLFTPRQLPKTLPNISFAGPTDQFAAMLDFYHQALPLLQAQNLSIQALQLDSSQNMMLTLNNGIMLKLLQQDALAELSRFLAVDSQLFGQKHKPIQSIDLRYPHGFAVQWQGGMHA